MKMKRPLSFSILKMKKMFLNFSIKCIFCLYTFSREPYLTVHRTFMFSKIKVKNVTLFAVVWFVGPSLSYPLFLLPSIGEYVSVPQRKERVKERRKGGIVAVSVKLENGGSNPNVRQQKIVDPFQFYISSMSLYHSRENS
jgi:hypothetical protein